MVGGAEAGAGDGLAEATLRVHKFRTGEFPGPQPTAEGGRKPRPPASPVDFLAAGCSWLPRSISSVRAPAPPSFQYTAQIVISLFWPPRQPCS